MAKDKLKIGALFRCKLDLWQKPNQIVRVEARKRRSPEGKATWYKVMMYFVVALDAPAGYGAWVLSSDLVPCGPLEILAAQQREM